MPIYDQSYKRWEGSFKSHSFRWWVISKYGIKTALKNKWVKRLLIFSLLPFLLYAFWVYGLMQKRALTKFLPPLQGVRAMREMSGKVYRVQIEGAPELFLDKLRKQGLRSEVTGSELKITVPDGENSKSIRAIAKQTATKISRLVPPGVEASFYNQYLNWLFIFLFLLLLVVGSGLVSKDVKFNALQIYLAKPITAIEYILGKLGIVVFFLVMITLVPGILLFLLQAILIGDSLYLRYYWWVPGAICGYSLLMVFSGALIVLALSAFSRNVWTAAIGAAAVLWFSPMVAGLLWRLTWNDKDLLLSLRHNWNRVGDKIFGLSGIMDVPWGWSFLIVLGIMVLCAVALVRRVRAVQVVK
mgnify:CR=1 FL=1